MKKISLAIVGFGKIARDQHVPALAKSNVFELAAIASLDGRLDGIANFQTVEALLEAMPGIGAVAICTPPQVRSAVATAALRACKHVLLEKPPGATISEIGPLVALARLQGVTLFASWHSRFAPAVQPARAFLATRRVLSVRCDWKEDVRVWHPGQRWIWEPGGLGVFDPGINALSILTAMLPTPFFLTACDLDFPSNCAAPIAAYLTFTDADATPIRAEFDFLQTGPPTRDIIVETDAGTLTLSEGGTRLLHDGLVLVDGPKAEYDALYQEFGRLIAQGESDVDLSPLVHVADAFMLGRHRAVGPFEDP